MPGNSEKGKGGNRFFRMLLEARWFFSFTSSLCATIIGISLTFGINSCREQQRAREEMKKSMLQAVDNLQERFDDAAQWVEIIEEQDRVYSVADSLYREGIELPDSICEDFRYTLPYVRIASFDHEFEKIFRGSYQIWQVQSERDRLAYYIGHCYDCLNLVESTCAELTEGLLEMIGSINASRHFYRMEPRQWTMALLSDPEFQYFMSVRRVKTDIISNVLKDAQSTYLTEVIPPSKKLE